MGEAQKPWAFVCRKGPRLGGVISADMPWKDIAKFLGEFAADGYSIVTVHTRDEYDALLKELPECG